MKGETINGQQVHIFKKGDRYMVICGIETYYTRKRPVTDQDVTAAKREQERILNMYHDRLED